MKGFTYPVKSGKDLSLDFSRFPSCPCVFIKAAQKGYGKVIYVSLSFLSCHLDYFTLLTDMCMYVWICVYICVCVVMWICVCICVCGYVYVYVYVDCVYMSTHT